MAPAKAKTVRKDPTPRFLGNMPFWDKLENSDPDRVYKWSNPTLGIEAGGTDRYVLSGYTVETLQPGGVRPAVTPRGLKEGDEIKIGDMLLVSIEREEHDAQQALGQRKADEQELQMIKNRGLDDPIRGIRSRNRYFRISSTLSPLERDFGGD